MSVYKLTLLGKQNKLIFFFFFTINGPAKAGATRLLPPALKHHVPQPCNTLHYWREGREIPMIIIKPMNVPIKNFSLVDHIQ